MCPVLSSLFHALSSGHCGSVSTKSTGWLDQNTDEWHILASSSSGALRRWQQLLHHCGGGSRIFALATNSKILCTCFCFTPAPLDIKIHLNKCTESWILFPCTISINIYSFISNILSLLFCIFYIYSSTDLLLLHLRCLYFFSCVPLVKCSCNYLSCIKLWRVSVRAPHLSVVSHILGWHLSSPASTLFSHSWDSIYLTKRTHTWDK